MDTEPAGAAAVPAARPACHGALDPRANRVRRARLPAVTRACGVACAASTARAGRAGLAGGHEDGRGAVAPDTSPRMRLRGPGGPARAALRLLIRGPAVLAGTGFRCATACRPLPASRPAACRGKDHPCP
jgi:hypothetical protein